MPAYAVSAPPVWESPAVVEPAVQRQLLLVHQQSTLVQQQLLLELRHTQAISAGHCVNRTASNSNVSPSHSGAARNGASTPNEVLQQMQEHAVQ